MLRNRGAALALSALLALGAYAAILSVSSSPQPIAQTKSAGEKHQKSKRTVDDDPPTFSIGDWAATNDKAILALTAIGAMLAASLLTIVTAGLWRVTKRLAFETERLGTAEHEQSIEMRRANEIAEKNFDLAEKQFLLAGRECDLAEKQHGLQRVMHLATHRPKLRVRYFRIINISDQQALIKFTIVNVGGSDAKLISSLGLAQFFPFNNRPIPVYLGGKEIIEAPTTFPHGATEEGTILLKKQSPGIVLDMWQDQRALHAFGHISYVDILGNMRMTAFCRRYTVGRERFDIVDDPDYEYED